MKSSSIVPPQKSWFFRFFPLVPQGRFWKRKKNLRGDGGGTFRLHFWNLHKIWIQESIDLNSVQFGWRCNIGWVTSVLTEGKHTEREQMNKQKNTYCLTQRFRDLKLNDILYSLLYLITFLEALGCGASKIKKQINSW